MMSFRKAVWLLALAAAWSAGPAAAQQYPSKPIRVVVSTPASSPIDILSRVVAERMQKALGSTVYVENKPGGLYKIGPTDVLKYPADGYTLMAVFQPLTVMPYLTDMPFDLLKDFDPISQTAFSYNVLVVPTSSKARSVKDLQSMLKSNADRMTYATGTLGSPSHVIAELFLLRNGARVTTVPYSVFTEAITSTVAGRNDFMFVATPPVVGMIRGGKLRALAVTGPRHLEALPGVPIMAEAGVADFVVRDWQGFVTRHGTPAAVVQRLNRAIVEIVRSDAMRATFDKLGADPEAGSPEDFRRLIESELKLWGDVVRRAGIKLPQ